MKLLLFDDHKTKIKKTNDKIILRNQVCKMINSQIKMTQN